MIPLNRHTAPKQRYGDYVFQETLSLCSSFLLSDGDRQSNEKCQSGADARCEDETERSVVGLDESCDRSVEQCGANSAELTCHMDDGAGCRGGFNSVVVCRKEQSAGHLEADGGTDYESADEEDCEGLGEVDDQEADDQRDEAAAQNVLMELLLKGVEDQAAEHTADEEYSHCGAGKGSGAHAALGYNEGDVRTHDAVGIDEHENDRAEQPGNGSNLEVALLAVASAGLSAGK